MKQRGMQSVLLLAFVVGCLGQNEIEDYTPRGCYMDKLQWRDLPYEASRDGKMTIQKCANMCKGYRYFGVQYHSYCFCGNEFGQYGLSSPDYCFKDCLGNLAQSCGGDYRSHIFEIHYKPGTFVPATRYQEIGCYTDQGVRDLPQFAATLLNMSPQICAEKCSGYPFFAIQYQTNCWCGADFGKYGRIDRGQCKMDCTGDRSYKCGDLWKNTVYINQGYQKNNWGGARYSGCFKYGTFPSAATVQEETMTVTRCAQVCQGYSYFALKQGNTCYCTNSLGEGGLEDPGSCYTRCKGSKTAICGGETAYSVFVLKEPFKSEA